MLCHKVSRRLHRGVSLGSATAFMFPAAPAGTGRIAARCGLTLRRDEIDRDHPPRSIFPLEMNAFGMDRNTPVYRIVDAADHGGSAAQPSLSCGARNRDLFISLATDGFRKGIHMRKVAVLADNALTKEFHIAERLRAETGADDLLRFRCRANIRMDRAAAGGVGVAAHTGTWGLLAFRLICRLLVHHENGSGGTFPPPPPLKTSPECP